MHWEILFYPIYPHAMVSHLKGSTSINSYIVSLFYYANKSK